MASYTEFSDLNFFSARNFQKILNKNLLHFFWSIGRLQLPLMELKIACGVDLVKVWRLNNISAYCTIWRGEGAFVPGNITLRYMALRLDLSERVNFHETAINFRFPGATLYEERTTHDWMTPFQKTLSERKYRFVFGRVNCPWVLHITGAGKKPRVKTILVN